MKATWQLIAMICLSATAAHSYACATTPQASEQLASSSSPRDSSSSIQALIKKLDSDRFKDREQATVELIAKGKSAVVPLSNHLLVATPESARRIKTCLETIATSGDESTFYQSLGILQLFFGSNHGRLDSQLARLTSQWAAKKQEQAIANLRKFGAVVTVSNRNRNDLRGIVVGPPVPDNDDWSPKPKRRSDPIIQLSKNELRSQLKKILGSSLEENRKRVLGSKTGGQSAMSLEELTAQREIEKMELWEQRLRVREQFGAPVSVSQSDSLLDGVRIEFNDKWKGDSKELSEIQDVNQLASITFNRRKVDKKTLQALLSTRNLNFLTFQRCSIDTESVRKVGLPKSLNAIRFLNQKIDKLTLDSILGQKQITSVAFNDCLFSKSALPGLFTSETIVQLELGGIEITPKMFADLRKMTNLRQLSLSACQFPADSYRQLRRERPGLRIDFAGKAFLGVRGNQGVFNGRGIGCLLTAVVPNTGASRAGLEANDVIESINGDPINSFEDLRLNVAQYRAGNVLKVKVKREGKPMTFKVKLGHINDAPED